MEAITFVALVYTATQWIYHRYWGDKPPPPKYADEIKVPIAGEGVVVPVYWGKVRVRSPILVQTGNYTVIPVDDFNMRQGGGADALYGIDMLFCAGIPFLDGNNHMHGMWGGDQKMRASPGLIAQGALSSKTGNGNHEQPTSMAGPIILDRTSTAAVNYPCGFGMVEFLNGRSTQELVDQSGINLSKTYAGDRLSTVPFTFPATAITPTITAPLGGVTPPGEMPGYRGYAMVFMFNGNAMMSAFTTNVSVDPFDLGYPTLTDVGAVISNPFASSVAVVPWIIGASPDVPAYSFEMSSYPAIGVSAQPGEDANPADVLYDILRGVMGKLGLPFSMVDYISFSICGTTLYEEGHGYSRVIEDSMTVGELIQEILRQIDGVIYEDPGTGTIKLRLVRADFDVNVIKHINADNCVELTPVALGGWTDITNKVRVTFTNRAKDYIQDSVTAHNQANAVGQDGIVREKVIDFPGCCTDTLATVLAQRELAALSRPISTFRATVDRTFLRSIPGDAVLVSDSEYGIDRMVFRIARISKGAPDTNHIVLDLIQDFFFTHRYEVNPNVLPVFPPSGSL